MSQLISEALFWMGGGLIGVGSVGLLAGKGDRAWVGYSVVAAGVATLSCLLGAVAVAVLQVLAAAGIVGLGLGSVRTRACVIPGFAAPLAAAILLSWVGFVLLGAMARQYLSSGSPLDLGSTFGSAPHLVRALNRTHTLALPVAGWCVIVALASACWRHRTSASIR
ncbi:MAG: hypothetical protein V3V08_06990 [Nannocystaceae bacterium]